MTITRIISGGQTGADRGGHDAASVLGLECGGWAPLGWRSEDGQIPVKYRRCMRESKSPAYPVRTRMNIEGSDATLILSLGDLSLDSGSYLTARLARTIGKPCLHMTIEKLSNPVGAAMAQGWLEGRDMRTLNVAGPRESREPGIQAAARDALVAFLRNYMEGRQ